MTATHETTLLWHDYETSGIDSRRDRPLQFAAWRTNLALEPVEEPLVLWCQPARDTLPHPQALLLTGIDLAQAQTDGVPECEFASRIHEQFARPGTCGVGYNSIRFDDEFSRFLFYRNFFDPYAREWQNGNSRWDLIDVARLAFALRPEGVEWPLRADGAPSFKLEELAKANALEQSRAHDALSDVSATIALARLLRGAQPRLYEYAFSLRHKSVALGLLDWLNLTPVLHVSGRYSAARGAGVAVVAPLGQVPGRSNEIIVYDLEHDPGELIELDAGEIEDRLYTARADLPEGVSRIALKTVHANRSPMLAPLSVLQDRDVERLALDMPRAHAHLERLRAHAHGLRAKLTEVYSRAPMASLDPDLALYDGFVADVDRARFAQLRAGLHRCDPAINFRDPRLSELAFRWRARNAPEALDAGEHARWQALRRERLLGASSATVLKYDDFKAIIAALKAATAPGDAAHCALDAQWLWAQNLLADLSD